MNQRTRSRPAERRAQWGTALLVPALLALLWLAITAGAPVTQPPEGEPPRSDAAPSATATNPHGPLAFACDECHTAERWTPLADPLPFEHAEDTGFPLLLAHRQAECVGCHRDLRFAFVATACV